LTITPDSATGYTPFSASKNRAFASFYPLSRAIRWLTGGHIGVAKKRPHIDYREVMMPPFEVSQQDIEAFRGDGAVLIRGLFAGHIEPIRAGMALCRRNDGA